MDYFSASGSSDVSFTNSTSASDASDASPFASFWNQISGTIIAQYSITSWTTSDLWSILYSFKKEVVDLAPTEKNMLDYPRGKLRMPKPVCPRGFKHLALRHEFSGPHYR